VRRARCSATARISRTIDQYIDANGIDAPLDTNEPISFAPPNSVEIDVIEEEISAIIWATGYALDFNWIKAPVFDDRGYPIYHRGVSELPGLYFLGLNWMWTWGSGRICSAGDGARYLNDHILAARGQSCLSAISPAIS